MMARRWRPATAVTSRPATGSGREWEPPPNGDAAAAPSRDATTSEPRDRIRAPREAHGRARAGMGARRRRGAGRRPGDPSAGATRPGLPPRPQLGPETRAQARPDPGSHRGHSSARRPERGRRSTRLPDRRPASGVLGAQACRRRIATAPGSCERPGGSASRLADCRRSAISSQRAGNDLRSRGLRIQLGRCRGQILVCRGAQPARSAQATHRTDSGRVSSRAAGISVPQSMHTPYLPASMRSSASSIRWIR
jgi:hypothetical protein